jgi:hypothetical protein
MATCRVFDGLSELLQPWKDRPLLGFHCPRDVECLWNKGPAIWFPRWAGHSCNAQHTTETGLMHFGALHAEGVAPKPEICMTRRYPREGGREVECKETE